VPARSSNCPPLVSVVLPVWNAAATLARAVASIRQQTISDWELIAVDDGSTDGSRNLLDAAAKSDGRVRVLTQPHRGIVAALNVGLEAARGGCIARMDADDEAHPERLAEQVDFLERDPTVGVVSCLVEYGGNRRAQAGYALHVDWINSLVSPEQIALNRFIESPFAHPSVMFRRELADRHGAYREGDFPEDYELWLRWLDAGVRMAKVPRTLLTWHDPPARLSRTAARYGTEAFYRLKAEWIARWLKAGREKERRAQRSRPTTRPVIVWGAGRLTRRRAEHLLAHGVRIAGYIDIDPKKIGRKVGGLPVIALTEVPPRGEIFVLGYVASRGARELARATLTNLGYAEGRDFLMCA
jgi:glycosyltransferase involved in cell wall biosynthesis